MSIKIKLDKEQKAEMAEYFKWLTACNEDWTRDNQEYIITTISLLLNSKFRSLIGNLRKEYKVKKYGALIRNDILDYDGYTVKIKDKLLKKDIPQHEIRNICEACNVDFSTYLQCIENYIYANHIEPLPLIDGFDNYGAFKNEYKYKSRVEVFGRKYQSPSGDRNTVRAYIQFYSDTTPNQIKNFIDDNASTIKGLQPLLSSYPHSKRYGSFKRDIQIYLLHLLGYKAPEIDEKIIEQNPDDTLFEVDIRQIIGDLHKRTQNASKA